MYLEQGIPPHTDDDGFMTGYITTTCQVYNYFIICKTLISTWNSMIVYGDVSVLNTRKGKVFGYCGW